MDHWGVSQAQETKEPALVEISTRCNTNEDCPLTMMCAGKSCVCPYSLVWSPTADQCVPKPCAPDFMAGYCPTGQVCYGTCKSIGCPRLSLEGCSTCPRCSPGEPAGFCPPEILNPVYDGEDVGVTFSCHEGVCVPLNCEKINAGVHAAARTTNWDVCEHYNFGQCVDNKCSQAPPMGAEVAAGSSCSTTIEAGDSAELVAAPNKVVLPNSCGPAKPGATCPPGLQCQDSNCVGLRCSESEPNGYCAPPYQCFDGTKFGVPGGVCLSVPGGVCAYLASQDPTKYPSFVNCLNKPATHECAANPLPGGNPYVCRCKRESGEFCMDDCGNVSPCPSGWHCPGPNSACVPNTSSSCAGKTCPNGLTCEAGNCVCRLPGCAGTPADLLTSILLPTTCPEYIQGGVNDLSTCFVNQLQKDVTVPNLTGVDQQGKVGTHAKGSAFMTGLDAGAMLAFDANAVSNQPSSDFLTQSYEGQPKATNLQGLFADDHNVGTISPQQCNPMPDSPTSACYGGGIPCEPGTTPIRLSPWISTKGMKTTDKGKPYPKPYFSVWACQKSYGQCPPYFHPELVYWKDQWVYGCMRNPLPTRQVCHQERTVGFDSGCGQTDTCDWSKTLSDSGYGMAECTHHNGLCRYTNDYNISDSLTGTKMPPGLFYYKTMKNGVSTLGYTSDPAGTTYPFTGYQMSCGDGTQNSYRTDCPNPFWTATLPE